MKDEFYMTVGDMRKAIEGLPDTARVFYERIEDVYFDKWNWEADMYLPTQGVPEQDQVFDEYLRAYAGYHRDGDLFITAHY